MMQDVPIVRNFGDVFLEELPGMPIDREIEFDINVMLGTQPVSKMPYRMATTKLKELKIQLHDMVNKNFIRPISSPWGATVLFVKKKTEQCGYASTTEN